MRARAAKMYNLVKQYQFDLIHSVMRKHIYLFSLENFENKILHIIIYTRLLIISLQSKFLVKKRRNSLASYETITTGADSGDKLSNTLSEPSHTGLVSSPDTGLEITLYSIPDVRPT